MEEFAALGMVPVSTSRQEILKTTQVWTASRRSRYSKTLIIQTQIVGSTHYFELDLDTLIQFVESEDMANSHVFVNYFNDSLSKQTF